MFKRFKTSLKHKLLVAFLAIGFFPYLLFLSYTMMLSETQIVEKSIENQTEKLHSIIKRIDFDLNSLKKELDFLASLDVMDDLLAEDIDKRVSRLLSQKSKDYDFKSQFFVIDSDNTILASSNKDTIAKTFFLDKKLFNADKNEFIINNKLYLFAKIYATFNPSQQIGVLVLEYPLSNLDAYLSHKKSIHSSIIDSNYNSLFTNALPFKVESVSKNSITDEHLIVSEKMLHSLNSYTMIYAVDKELALASLYDFIRFMLYISPLILLIIVVVALKSSQAIVKPIEKLTKVSQDIVLSKNYSHKLEADSSDEISILTQSFNELLSTTDNALKHLQIESSLRLQRFIQLIEIFNTIIQTKDESSCIETSIEQIKLLSKNDNISFSRVDSNSANSIALSVSDFESDSKVFYGELIVDENQLVEENEKRFYYSIGSMISLQLDRIRLIERTMSASRAKSDFISNMSHELRTPLNAIIGFSQYMISYEELNDDQLDVMSNIESSAQYLLRMINEILDMAKIEAGKMEVKIESVNVVELLKSSFMMLKALADEKALNFRFEYDENIQTDYMTDSKMFQQITINLLSNAIKFTREGDVVLSLKKESNKLVVSVKDSGLGISEDKIKLLFNEFVQVENVMQKEHKGTGLGLALSKKMANLLNGDVILESEGEGHGTTSKFWINL